MTWHGSTRSFSCLWWDGERWWTLYWEQPVSQLRKLRRVLPQWGDTEMALMRRNTVSPAGDGDPGRGLSVPDEMANCPTAWEFLTMASWPDTKKPRELGSVLFFVDGAGLKCRLMDNDAGQCAFGVIQTDEGVWNGVEAMLTSTSTDWRPVAKGSAPRRK
jgi:hypothetical protein